MKILLITTRFFPHKGGVEEVVANISENISKDNDLRVLSSLDIEHGLSRAEQILKVSTPEGEVNGIRNKRIWINLPGSFLGILIFPYRFLKSISELITYVKSFRPDVINYHFPDDASVYLDILTVATRIPLVVNIHGNDLQVYSKKPFHKFFVNRLLKRSKAIVVNSAYMRAEFLSSFPSLDDKVKIISNGLNVKFYRDIKARPYTTVPYIFYIGRIVQKKGVDILVKAFDKMNNLNLHLLIEGKGEELDNIKRLVKKCDLAEQVTFTNGTLTNEEKVAAMKGAVFGVVPSRIEPFGIVALEYMASGIPFIASKTGGLIDLLKDGETTLFFDPGNIDELKEKMEKIISNEELRGKLSGNGLKEVENFEWEVISNKYYNLYKEVI